MSSDSSDIIDDKRLIVVCGASGAQGSSVARHLLRERQFAVRVLARNLECEAIREFQSLGAEVAVADFDEPETLVRAFHGAYGVFGTTKYDEQSGKCEAHGKAMVDAAKKNGVRHFIWSNWPAIIDASSFMDPCVPHTIFYPAISYSVALSLISPGSGHWTGFFFVPLDTIMPMIALDDIGPWVSHALCNPTEWKGRCMKPCTEMRTWGESLKMMEEFTGLPISSNNPTKADIPAFEQLVPDVWKGLNWYIEEAASFYDPQLGRAIYPKAKGWLDYLSERLDPRPDCVPPVVVELDVDEVTLSY